MASAVCVFSFRSNGSVFEPISLTFLGAFSGAPGGPSLASFWALAGCFFGALGPSRFWSLSIAVIKNRLKGWSQTALFGGIICQPRGLIFEPLSGPHLGQFWALSLTALLSS